MSSNSELRKLIVAALNNEELLHNLLDKINSNDFKKNLNYVYHVLEECSNESSNKFILNICMSKFIKIFELETIEDIFSIILSITMLSDKCIRYLFNMYDISGYSILHRFLFKNHKMGNFITMYNIIIRIRNEQISAGGISELLELTNDENIIDFLNLTKNDKNNNAPYPVWVTKDYNFDHKYLDYENWSNDHFEENDICLIEEKFKTMFTCPNINLNPIIKKCIEYNSNVDPDIIFGPVNSDVECCSSIRGGCRMLSCTCKEEKYYTGVCYSCNKKIRDPSHGIRFPLPEGGWINFYCNMTCMIKNPPDLEENSDINIIELNLDHMTECFQNKGIYDRFIETNLKK